MAKVVDYNTTRLESQGWGLLQMKKDQDTLFQRVSQHDRMLRDPQNGVLHQRVAVASVSRQTALLPQAPGRRHASQGQGLADMWNTDISAGRTDGRSAR